jgi:hypothetical protein
MSELIEEIDFELKMDEGSFYSMSDTAREILESYKEALQQSKWVSVDDKPKEDIKECLVGVWLGKEWVWERGSYDSEFDLFLDKYSNLQNNGSRFTHYQLVTLPAKEQR